MYFTNSFRLIWVRTTSLIWSCCPMAKMAKGQAETRKVRMEAARDRVVRSKPTGPHQINQNQNTKSQSRLALQWSWASWKIRLTSYLDLRNTDNNKKAKKLQTRAHTISQTWQRRRRSYKTFQEMNRPKTQSRTTKSLMRSKAHKSRGSCKSLIKVPYRIGRRSQSKIRFPWNSIHMHDMIHRRLSYHLLSPRL